MALVQFDSLDMPIVGTEGNELYLVIIPAENPLEDETFAQIVRANTHAGARQKVAKNAALDIMGKLEHEILLVEEKEEYAGHMEFEMRKPMVIKYLGAIVEVSTANNIPL